MNSFTFLIKLVLQSDRYQKVDAIRNLREQLKAAQKHAMEIRASQAHIRQAHTRYNAYMRDVQTKENQARRLLTERMNIQRRLMDLEARHKITQSTTGYLKNKGHYDGIYNRAKLSLRSQGIANDYARRAAMGSLNNARANAPFTTGQLRQLILDGRKVGLDRGGLRNVLQGKAPLPSGASTALQDAVSGKIGMLQQALSNLSRATFVLQTAFVALGTFIKVELVGMLGQAITHFGSEIGTVFKLMIFSKMRQFLEPFSQIRQMEIPLEVLTGLSRKSIEGSIREVANLPAVDFLSAGRGLLDLINADPNHDMALATKRLKTLANAVFAAGGGPEQLDFVTLAIKQMMGKDKVSGQEIRQQIAQHIPSVFRFTKEQYGTSDIRELNNMGVSTEDFVNKLIAWLEKNTPQLPMSPQTMMENLDDRILQAMAGIGEGIFNKLEGALSELIVVFDELIDNGAFQKIGESMAALFGMTEGLGEGLRDLITTVKGTIDGLTAFKFGLGKVWGHVTAVTAFFLRALEWILNPVAATARAMGNSELANKLDLLNPLTAGFGAIDEFLKTMDEAKKQAERDLLGPGTGGVGAKGVIGGVGGQSIRQVKDAISAGVKGAAGVKGLPVEDLHYNLAYDQKMNDQWLASEFERFNQLWPQAKSEYDRFRSTTDRSGRTGMGNPTKELLAGRQFTADYRNAIEERMGQSFMKWYSRTTKPTSLEDFYAGKYPIYGDPQTMNNNARSRMLGHVGGGAASPAGDMMAGIAELSRAIQDKPSADEIIMGGNDARRIVSPADLSSGRKANPTINVQVKSVDLFGRAVQEMVFDVVTDLVKQGFLPGER